MTSFVPLAAADTATNTQAMSYSARRTLLSRDPTAPALSGAAARLPLTIQVAFRRKVLAIFAIQLLLVALSVTVVTHVPSFHDAWATALDDTPSLIAVPAIATLVLLGVMYKLRTVHPWNWLSLVLFTLALCYVYAGVDILVHTHACLLYCVAMFVWSLLVTALAGVTRRDSSSDKSAATLLSPVVSGIFALVVVVAGEIALFALVKDEALVTTAGLIGSLAFQIVTAVWFAVDAAKMFQVLTPDEYMLGVTYFYTDMVTFLVVVTIGATLGGAGAGAMMTTAEAGINTEDDQV